MEQKKSMFKYIPLAIIALCLITVTMLIRRNDAEQYDSARAHSDSVTVTIMGEAHQLNVSYDNPVQDNYTLTSIVPVVFEISEFTGLKVTINGTPFISGEQKRISISKIGKDETVNIEFFDLNDQKIGEAKINTLPQSAPPIMVLKDTDLEGDMQYAYTVDNYIYLLNQNGEVEFYRNAGEEIYDFQTHIVEGRKFYSFFVKVGERNTNQVVMSAVADSRLARMILDESFMFYDWVEYMTPTERVPEGQPIENEEFQMIGEKDYLIAAYVGKRVYNTPDGPSGMGNRVAALVIQEIRDGQVVFEWDSTEEKVLYGNAEQFAAYSVPNEIWMDYAHLNTLMWDYSGKTAYLALGATGKIINLNVQNNQIRWVTDLQECGVIKTGESYFADFGEDGFLTVLKPGGEGKSLMLQELTMNQENGTVELVKSYSSNVKIGCVRSFERTETGNYKILWEDEHTDYQGMTEIDIKNNICIMEIVSKTN